MRTSSGVAPFCGPKTADAPFGPTRGLSTSQATSIEQSVRRGSSPATSMPLEAGERAAAVRQLAAARVEQANAERLQHPGAAVVRGAAADADDEPARAVVEGGPDQFADAEGRRHQRIAQGRRNELEPRSRGHFDHRDAAVARDAVKRLDLVAERPDDPARDATPSGRSDKRVHGAFPAVGDRQKDIIRVGVDGAESLADGERRVERRQALLERVRRNHDLHRQAPEVAAG